MGDSGVPYLLLNQHDDDQTMTENTTIGTTVVTSSHTDDDDNDGTNKTDNSAIYNNNNDNNDEERSMNIIKGELWLISDETLNSLDDYEGIQKGYYVRKEESVELILNQNNKKIENHNTTGKFSETMNPHESEEDILHQAHVYGLVEMPSHLSKQKLSFISEYTLDFHQTCYKPIRHIQVKQQKHLNDEVGTCSES